MPSDTYDSACDVLTDTPDRFTIYIYADARIRDSIVDENTFLIGIKKAFRSDPMLHNILTNTKKPVDDCLKSVYMTKDIQTLIEKNLQRKQVEIRQRVRRQRPELRGKALQKEINRRFKISQSRAKAHVKAIKQVTIEQSLKPIRVHYTDPKTGKTVKYRKSAYKKLLKPEEDLIKNNIKKGKKPAEILEIHRKQFPNRFRSKASIKRHYTTVKRKLREGTLKAMGDDGWF